MAHGVLGIATAGAVVQVYLRRKGQGLAGAESDIE